jgi:hypothetical protein
MPVGEFQKLLAIDLIRQDPQRLISLLPITQMTQGVNQPLSAVRHGITVPVARLAILHARRAAGKALSIMWMPCRVPMSEYWSSPTPFAWCDWNSSVPKLLRLVYDPLLSWGRSAIASALSPL